MLFKQILKKTVAIFLIIFAIITVLLWIVPFLRNTTIIIPESARWVRSKIAKIPGPGGEEWIKMHVPRDELYASAEAILRENALSSSSNGFQIKRRDLIKKAFASGHSEDAPWWYKPWWFKPEKIERGYILYVEDANSPLLINLWVDSENDIIFVNLSD